MEEDQDFNRELESATAGVAKLAVQSGSSNEAGSLPDSAIKSTPASSLVNSDRARFNELVTRGKEKTRQGDLYGALVLYQNAYKIHESQKLAKRIQKLKEFICENENENEEDEEEEDEGDEEDDDGMVEVGNGFRLAAAIYDALYPYQKHAVLWFWGLYKQKKGGILGDDMGLGKTIQVIAFLSGMFDSELIKSALIVMPVSVLENWEREWKKWSPGIRVRAFHGSSKKDRNWNLEKVQKHDGVCLTTYGMVVSNHETLSQDWRGQHFKWDYIILDEGHKIKNTTKTSKNVRAIPADHHFILTGTPVQNNLREMWALFDFVCQGKLLGTSRTFKQEYENPIVRARERDASAYEKRIGNEMSESLRKLIKPHFLRRTKAMVLEKENKVKTENVNKVEDDKVDSAVKLPTSLTRKNDLIVWLYMSDTQIQIYRDFLRLERVKEILMSSRSPLVELNVLKKITDHPRLLSALACSQLGLNEGQPIFDTDEDKENLDSSAAGSFVQDLNKGGISDKTLIEESGKVHFLVKLLDNLKEEGHRCLVFSQSRKILDIIQRVIKHRGHKVLRIDGTISKTAERQRLITTFQNNPSYSCFLLTTQVGGVGITLTAADRVVIFDPSWNPATDAQAVDRVYRIGQKRTVVIYRLITCGTIEEKIYRKQVFKDALMQQTTGSSKNPFRYFTRQDLRDLFTLDDPRKSATQLQLDKMHAHNRKTDELLDKHIGFLHSLNIFGISDHDLMYSQEAVVTDDEMAESGFHDTIQARVLRAQNMVAAESGNSVIRAAGRFPESFQHQRSFTQKGTSEPIGSVPIDWPRLSAREKVQAALNQAEVFKPKREDNKRFVPSGGKRRSDPKVGKPVSTPEIICVSDSPTTTPSDSNPPRTATAQAPSSSGFVDLVEQESSYTLMEKSLSSLNLSEPNVRENHNKNKVGVSENIPGDRSSDSQSEDEGELTACSPIFAKSIESQSGLAKTESDDELERGNEENSPEVSQSSYKERRRQIISSESEGENGESYERASSDKQLSFQNRESLQSNSGSVDVSMVSMSLGEESIEEVGHLNDSHQDYSGNVDGSKVEDKTADVKEAGEAAEDKCLSEVYHFPTVDGQTTSEKEKTHSSITHSHHRFDAVDDDVIFVPRSARKFRRVKKLIVSDDDDGDDVDEKAENPVRDHRRSILRRRSQMIYPSSSDEEVEGEESALEANELSDRSEISNQSQSEAITESEETDTTHNSSAESTSQDQLSSNRSSYEDDHFVDQVDGSSEENHRQTSSACPSGKHVSSVVNIFKCPCVVTDEQVVRYKDYLIRGRLALLEGKEEEALGHYLSAIDIQDSDVRLHKKILVLQKKLEL